MKTLLTLLPLTFALCGCSAFVPVALENSTINESAKHTLISETRSNSNPYPFLDAYAVGIGQDEGSLFYSIAGPDGNASNYISTSALVNVSLSTPSGYATASFVFDWSEDWSTLYAHVGLTFDVGDVSRERLAEAYYQMQVDQSYSLGTGWGVSEFNYENRPEISLDKEWPNSTQATTYAIFTLPVMYRVEYQAFGCDEMQAVSWHKHGTSFDLSFNAKAGYGFYMDDLIANNQVSAGYFLDYAVFTSNPLATPYADFASDLDISVVSGFLTTDVVFRVGAIYLDFEVLGDYADGYDDGLTEGNKPVSWFKNIFDGMASFFSVQIIPNISLGLIMFSPLLVLAIIVIVRVFKHGG